MTVQTKRCVTVLYPNTPGARFDWNYYLSTHTPKAKAAFGGAFTITRGLASLDGMAPTYLCICTIAIESLERFSSIMAQHGAAIQSDIPNYTDVTPIIQIDEVL
jgi:uncharacterized protein (TIGR02118 family)